MFAAMKFRLLFAALLASVSLLIASCQKPPAENPSAEKFPAVYEVKGVVRALMPEKKEVTIAHEEIPGYMVAMTMDFAVTNAAELTGLMPGDSVTFRMTVTKDDGWIDQIKRTGVTNAPPPPPAETFRRAREVEPLVVGDTVPEYTFTNELGRLVRLTEMKGTAYALNFIFTRCPFPTFCPRASKSFSETQDKLKSMNGPTNWHLFSITIDPAYDTLPRLKGYAKTYGADGSRWNFLTGDLEDITAIAEQFGLQFWRETPDALPFHNLRTVVIDAAGRVQWVTMQEDWSADAMVEQMVKAAQVR